MIKKIREAIKTFFIAIINIFSTEAKQVVEENYWGGLLWIWKKDTDYLFTGGISAEAELKRRWVINRQVKYEYNQWAEYETRNWCTVFSAVTELSWLFDYKFAKCEIKEIWHKMIADWKLNPDNWAYLSDSIDYSRRWWNENFPDKKVTSYSINYSDKILRNLLIHINPRLTQIGYRTSWALHKELQETWVASKKNYDKIWGHAVSQWGLNTIDNYFWRLKRNRYSFQYMDDLIKNGVIFKNWYLFLKN